MVLVKDRMRNAPKEYFYKYGKTFSKQHLESLGITLLFEYDPIEWYNEIDAGTRAPIIIKKQYFKYGKKSFFEALELNYKKIQTLKRWETLDNNQDDEFQQLLISDKENELVEVVLSNSIKQLEFDYEKP